MLLPAVITALTALGLSVIAGLVFQSADADPRRHGFANPLMMVLGFAIAILGIFSLFLWFNYLIVGPIQHVSESVNRN